MKDHFGADREWKNLPDSPSEKAWDTARAIPWSTPEFSRRLLREQLNPAHDRGARRPHIIAAHVDWIHRFVLRCKPSRILDIGCGPGLYTQALAELGHACTGIDFAPAVIEYAQQKASNAGRQCIYHCSDLLSLSDYRFGQKPYDLILFLYGEFCALQADQANAILMKCQSALVTGGRMVLEVLQANAVRQIGIQTRYCAHYSKGVFNDHPYRCFEDYSWNPASRTSVIRYRIINDDSSELQTYLQTFLEWPEEQLHTLFHKCGFRVIDTCLHIAGVIDNNEDDLKTWILRTIR